MAKTHLDELVEYPQKAIQLLINDTDFLALLLNKSASNIDDDDIDDALDNHIFTYEYIDDTLNTTGSYVWIEAEVPSVANKQIKNMKLYVTVCVHKQMMKINNQIISGISGNRRDNLVRFIDKNLNGNEIFGLGKLSLTSIKTVSSTNTNYALRELAYSIPDFNIKD